MSYFITRQLPTLSPFVFAGRAGWEDKVSLGAWVSLRALELQFTANDLRTLADDCGYDGPPFLWDEMRRFEIRCELDAAFFHLYLPAEPNGGWRPTDEESQAELAELRRHFPTPRDAVAHILDQFPVVRQKDEQLFEGRYRTKERILEVYDAMLAAIRSGQPFRTSLDPPPGTLAPTREAVPAQ